MTGLGISAMLYLKNKCCKIEIKQKIEEVEQDEK